MADPMREAQPHPKGKEDKGSPFKPSHNANKEFAHYEARVPCTCSPRAWPSSAATRCAGQLHALAG